MTEEEKKIANTINSTPMAVVAKVAAAARAGALRAPKPGHSLLSRLPAQPAAQVLSGGLAGGSYNLPVVFLLPTSPCVSVSHVSLVLS